MLQHKNKMKWKERNRSEAEIQEMIPRSENLV